MEVKESEETESEEGKGTHVVFVEDSPTFDESEEPQKDEEDQTKLILESEKENSAKESHESVKGKLDKEQDEAQESTPTNKTEEIKVCIGSPLGKAPIATISEVTLNEFDFC